MNPYDVRILWAGPSETGPAAVPVRSFAVQRWRRGRQTIDDEDCVALEEPLLIRVGDRAVAVVMRTPGHDRELAAGFLLTEGVIRRRDDLLDLLVCRDLADAAEGNVVEAILAQGIDVDYERLTRHVFSGSSCGICGKTTLDAVFQDVAPVESSAVFSPPVLTELPGRLADAQPGFGATGGVHASALFSTDGHLEVVREDVGRHNALDKVLGRALLDDRLPLGEHGLLVSGRVSFELVQKSVVAGIPLIAGIGAPSSLAVECARRAGQTLIGFVRSDRMNIYTDPGRLLV
jgi:FdhD protein